MNDIQILRYNAEKVMDIIQSPLSIAEQEEQIKELLKDIEGEVIIEKCLDGDFEFIRRVSVKPVTVDLFRQFDARGADAAFIALTRVYGTYLWCEKTGATEPLYDALLEYERVTHYPVTKCSPNDADWMKIEASIIIEHTLVQPQSTSQTSDDNEIVKIIKKVFPEAQVKSWF